VVRQKAINIVPEVFTDHDQLLMVGKQAVMGHYGAIKGSLSPSVIIVGPLPASTWAFTFAQTRLSGKKNPLHEGRGSYKTIFKAVASLFVYNILLAVIAIIYLRKGKRTRMPGINRMMITH